MAPYRTDDDTDDDLDIPSPLGAVMPRADDEPPDWRDRPDPYNLLRRDIPAQPMPGADDVPATEAAAGYTGDYGRALGSTQGALGVVPPLVRTEAGVFLAGDDGQPILANGQPVTLDQYTRAQQAAGGSYASHYAGGMTPEQQRTAAGSSQRWGTADLAHDPQWLAQKAQFAASYGNHSDAQLYAGQAVQVVGQQQQQLQALMERAQQDPYLSPAQRSQALSHLYQQMGQVAQHGQAARAVGQRAAAAQAGLHPDYGTPNGPELSPQARQQLQDAENGIQLVRTATDMSDSQKLYAVTALSSKVQQIDPAGRYRNGQQPMSAVEKALAQQVHTDPETGTVYSINPKTGELKPYFPRPQPKAAKEEPSRFEDIPLKDQRKMVLDYAKEYGLPYAEAFQHVRQQMGMHETGDPGFDHYGDPGERRAAQMQATATVQNFLMGQPVDLGRARQAYANMHPEVRWQVEEAAGDLDGQMQKWEQRRQQAAASGMAFSMPDRATVASRQQRAQALTAAPQQGAAAAQAAGLNQPLLTREQRAQQFKEQQTTHKEQLQQQTQQVKDEEAARRWYVDHESKLRADARHRVGLAPHKDDQGNLTPNPAALDIGDVDRVVGMQKAELGLAPSLAEHMQQHFQARGLPVPQRWQQQPAGQQGGATATPAPAAPLPSFVPSGSPFDDLIRQGRGQDPASRPGRVAQAALTMKQVLAEQGGKRLPDYPEAARRQAVRALITLRNEADPSIKVPPELETLYGGK